MQFFVFLATQPVPNLDLFGIERAIHCDIGLRADHPAVPQLGVAQLENGLSSHLESVITRSAIKIGFLTVKRNQFSVLRLV